MIENIRWWISTKKHTNLWQWVKYNYSNKDLHDIVNYCTKTNMHEGYDPLAGLTLDQQMIDFDNWQNAVKRIYRRYKRDVWHVNLGAFDERQDKNVFQALSRLPLADQVNNDIYFEEFMVRNALNFIALKLLNEK